eukprot:13261309-Ditylum_brightwellii.AAC.1
MPVANLSPSMAGIQTCNKTSLGHISSTEQLIALQDMLYRIYQGTIESVIYALVSVYVDDGLGPTAVR